MNGKITGADGRVTPLPRGMMGQSGSLGRRSGGHGAGFSCGRAALALAASGLAASGLAASELAAHELAAPVAGELRTG
ncbi:MAG TPA: hypothetical protein VKD26_05845 [Streptosporangiaceae bacterium]|nr:hypothetical protein [Streptosporangiaceae bacterium]